MGDVIDLGERRRATERDRRVDEAKEDGRLLVGRIIAELPGEPDEIAIGGAGFEARGVVMPQDHAARLCALIFECMDRDNQAKLVGRLRGIWERGGKADQ